MDTHNNKSLKNVCCGMVNETALPDMCAFSKGHKLRTAAFFTGVKKKKKKTYMLIFYMHPSHSRLLTEQKKRLENPHKTEATSNVQYVISQN